MWRKVRLCLIICISKNFDIFSPMMTNHLLLVENENSMDELKVNVDIRMNLVVNEEQTNMWFARTTKEIVKVQFFLIILRRNLKL